MTAKLAEIAALFALADYRRLWCVGGLTGVCRWLEFIALGIYAWEVTRSPRLVALLAVLRMMPYVLLGFFTGAIADAIDRKSAMIASLAIMTLTAGLMSVLTASGSAGYGAVAVATMISGAFWTTDMPLRRRLLVDAAGGKVAAALGFDNATAYAARAIGPLTGGIAYQSLGIAGIYALIGASYLASLLLAARLATGPRAAPGEGRSLGKRLALLVPPRALVLSRPFLVVLGVTLVYNMWCFPFVSMVPVIAQKDFALAPAAVGALSACDGIGGTVGALVVGALAGERTLFRFYFLGTLGFLLLIAALSLHLTVGATVATLLMLGVAAAFFSATQYGLIYVMSPPEARGRVTGVLSLCIGSSMLGHYHAGLLFDRSASPDAMRIMAAEGAVAMLALGLLWWRAPSAGKPGHR